MTNLEQLDIAIVEALWGRPYEEALYKELESDECVCLRGENSELLGIIGIPNTIGRVMAAWTKTALLAGMEWESFAEALGDDGWKLLNEDKTECTTKDQSPETIEKLLELFKK